MLEHREESKRKKIEYRKGSKERRRKRWDRIGRWSLSEDSQKSGTVGPPLGLVEKGRRSP